MSYRPLTITSPLYTAGATMWSRSMQSWVTTWILSEMHAGVPEMVTVDGWRAALTDLEELKPSGTPWCGGVAAIAKFFDQIIRTVVYTMADSGLPQTFSTAS